jgi:hypothetical protein
MTKKRQSANNNSLYQYIDSKYKIRGATADSRMSDYTPTKNSTEIKSKGFKLKPSKPVDIPLAHEKDQSRTKRDLITNDKIPLELQQFSFVDKIRRTFHDQKYMKREDVIKLLKQIQGS